MTPSAARVEARELPGWDGSPLRRGSGERHPLVAPSCILPGLHSAGADAGGRCAGLMEQTDLYKVLQVDPSAEPEVIQAAYRRLGRLYHPDTNPSPDAHEVMSALNRAYEVLGDPTRRAEYDRSRGTQPRTTRPQGGPGRPPPSRPRGARRPAGQGARPSASPPRGPSTGDGSGEAAARRAAPSSSGVGTSEGKLGWPYKVAIGLAVVGVLFILSGVLVGAPFYHALMQVMEWAGAPDDRDFLPLPTTERTPLPGGGVRLPVDAGEMGGGILRQVGSLFFALAILLALIAGMWRFARLLGPRAPTRQGWAGRRGRMDLAGLLLVLLWLACAILVGTLDTVLYELEPAMDGGLYDYLDLLVSPTFVVGSYVAFLGGTLLLLFGGPQRRHTLLRRNPQWAAVVVGLFLFMFCYMFMVDVLPEALSNYAWFLGTEPLHWAGWYGTVSEWGTTAGVLLIVAGTIASVYFAVAASSPASDPE